MAVQTIGFKTPPPKDGNGMPLAGGSDIPTMRPRTGARGSDREMVKALETAMGYLSESVCSFWACEGPRRPRAMCTCGKCYAMREIGTVIATLKARGQPAGQLELTPLLAFPSTIKSLQQLESEIVADLQIAINAFKSINH